MSDLAPTNPWAIEAAKQLEAHLREKGPQSFSELKGWATAQGGKIEKQLFDLCEWALANAPIERVRRHGAASAFCIKGAFVEDRKAADPGPPAPRAAKPIAKSPSAAPPAAPRKPPAAIPARAKPAAAAPPPPPKPPITQNASATRTPPPARPTEEKTMQEDWIDSAAAAKLLGVTKSAMNYYAKKIKSRKTGEGIRAPREWLRSAVEEAASKRTPRKSRKSISPPQKRPTKKGASIELQIRWLVDGCALGKFDAWKAIDQIGELVGARR